MPERHPVACEAQILGVVIGGDEAPRRQPLAAELGQHEALAWSQLDLALERLAHGAKPTRGRHSHMSPIGQRAPAMKISLI